MSLEYEEARRFFKNPVCKAKSYQVDVTNQTTLLLEQNFFRRRALITSTVLTNRITNTNSNEPATSFVLAFVVSDAIEIKTQEAVYVFDVTGGDPCFVWEEYWDEGALPP